MCRSVSAMAAQDWAKEDQRRMLHAVYRVGNLDEQIEYYKKHFGFKLLRYRDVPEVRSLGSQTPEFLEVGLTGKVSRYFV